MPDDALRPETRRALAEVAAHLDLDRAEALRGMCAVAETRQIKHGRFGPEGSTERTESQAADAEGDAEDLRPLFRGDAYRRTELPADVPGHARVRCLRREPTEDPEVLGFELTLQTDPPRLLRAEAIAADLPGIARLAMESLATSMTFGYVGGVPVPTELRMRVRSRGVDRFRFDFESVTTVEYRPCA